MALTVPSHISSSTPSRFEASNNRMNSALQSAVMPGYAEFAMSPGIPVKAMGLVGWIISIATTMIHRSFQTCKHLECEVQCNGGR